MDYWVGEMLLGHAPKGLDIIYIQTHTFNQCKIALDKWHDYLVKQGLLEVFNAINFNDVVVVITWCG